MRKMIGVIGVALIVAVLIASFVAYFLYTTNPATNIMHDGFGRQLSQSPFLIRWIFGQDRLWAGWLWFVGDMVIFWGGLFVGFNLISWGFKLKETTQR